MRTVSLIIVVILILIAFNLYAIKKSFKLYYKIDDISLNNFNASSFVSGNTSIQTRVEFLLYYSGLIKVYISDLSMEVYYNKALVSKLSDVPENKKTIVLSPNVNNLVYLTFDLYAKLQTADLISKIKLKEPYILNYVVSGKIFAVPFNRNSSISSSQITM